MRCGYLRMVSSALLLLSLVSAPHPTGGSCKALGSAVDSQASAALIAEFYPCALAGDEYFSVYCAGDLYICLRGWSVTDGEGEIRFVSDLFIFPGQIFTVTFNASSYWSAYGRLPEIALDSPGVGSLVTINGSFRLADSGDSLTLKTPDCAIVDAVVYGSANCSIPGWRGPAVPSLRRGEVAKRLDIGGIPVDTDCAYDWQPFREFRYGFTQTPSKRFDIPAGDITAFTSPDCSLDIVSEAIDNARETVLICTYEFSSAPVSKRLLAALDRGVRVVILVDGAPAGDISRREEACLSVLRLAGGEVLMVNGNLSAAIVQHVGALHAKYMVIDSSRVVVMSENFAEDGISSDTVFGNRGWGAMIDSSDLAGYLEGIFKSDSRKGRLDVTDWHSDPRFNASALLPDSSRASCGFVLLGPFVSTSSAAVTVAASPDASLRYPYLLDFLQPTDSLIVEQFQADLFWTSRWTGQSDINPLLLRVSARSQGGADLRMLFDSSWFNIDRNKQVIDYLDRSSAPDSSAECRLLDARSPITLLHNKGLIVDERLVAITSNNWVSASFARNRELGIVIDSPEIARHFIRAFEYDWVPDQTPPICGAGADIEVSLGEDILLDAGNCTDDRCIVNYSWDFDADGVIDEYGPRALYKGSVPGEHVVVLRIEDSWGNAASDELRLEVVSPIPYNKDGSRLGISSTIWLVPAVLASSVFFGWAFRRRSASSRSRNLNHRPRS